ncbi:hypothetical protein LF599_13860 [Pseudodesulfovibrio thermohalotolerans]|uniref:hypothetical protein n=1 Tax=Pseudodesulfovibrio thermohalotolerans TaxID=2880651 RepID=UPI0024417C94|nr:hypothetical protein [Pseudodesulfovibrio thermohalotolerans]WFS61749.1 hypothetical protein LF599_13860 [Pseudodesulfovibrio thermohalotolerans]
MRTISTQYGELIPQHTADDLRKREIMPVEYHASGGIKSVPLEEQTVIATSAGDIPAELVSFHENGSLNRIFPLNGKLSGYWSQDDEAGLSVPITLTTPMGVIRVRILSAGFYDDQSLRSLTLWPGETVSVPTPAGPVVARIGVSFTRDGRVRSLEPAKPVAVPTPAGEMTAYDPDAVGVNGDANSLAFNDEGKVCRLSTTLSGLIAVHPDGRTHRHVPQYRESLCSEAEQEVVPMRVEFDGDEVRIAIRPDRPATILKGKGYVFFAEPFLPQLPDMFTGLRCSV